MDHYPPPRWVGGSAQRALRVAGPCQRLEPRAMHGGETELVTRGRFVALAAAHVREDRSEPPGMIQHCGLDLWRNRQLRQQLRQGARIERVESADQAHRERRVRLRS